MSFLFPISTAGLGALVMVASVNTVAKTAGSSLAVVTGDFTISEQRVREIDDSIRHANTEKVKSFNGDKLGRGPL